MSDPHRREFFNVLKGGVLGALASEAGHTVYDFASKEDAPEFSQKEIDEMSSMIGINSEQLIKSFTLARELNGAILSIQQGFRVARIQAEGGVIKVRVQEIEHNENRLNHANKI